MGVTSQPLAGASEIAAATPSASQATATPGWNVIVTLPEATAAQARRVLRRWGRLHRTPYFHVLVMAVPDPEQFLREFGAAVAETPGILNSIAHVFAAPQTLDFTTVEDFETKARELVLAWAPALAGRRLHVRLHRRGLKGVLSTPTEERFLDEALLEALNSAGTPGRIDFEDPDFIIHIETIDHRAGIALWSREDMQRYRFLSLSR
jgi:hypothetical protein